MPPSIYLMNTNRTIAMSTTTKREFGNTNEENELIKGPWSLEEDSLLIRYISLHGEGRWNMLAKSAGLKRNGKSCRLRWLNYLKPNIKKGDLSPQEQLLILELHSKWGNKWAKIAQHLPGRTDNMIKNFWRTRVKKQARELNIESGSERFHDVWMPRLLQKMEQNPSSISDHSSVRNMNNFGNSFEASTSFNVPSISPSSQYSFIDASSNHHLNAMSLSTSFDSPSLDFLQFSQPLEISENSKSVPNVLDNNVYNCPIQDNYYVDDTNNYGLEGLNFDLPSSMETCDFSQFDFQTSGSGWMLDNMANDTLWNMDTM